MKARKVISLLCTAAVIMSFFGCNRNNSAVTPTDTQTQMPAQNTVSTASSDEVPVFMLEKLPEIGEYVDDIVCKRRYPETRTTLTPGEDYGKLIPFVGAFREYHFVDYETGEWKDETYSVSKYGLMTDKGEIIVDAVYDYINIIPCSNGGQIFELSMLGENFETLGQKLICPSDGSWIITGEESVMYDGESEIGDTIVTVDNSDVDWDNSTGTPKTIFYNRQGQKTAEISNSSPSDGNFSEGYILLDLYSDYFNGESDSRFFDRNGNPAFDGISAKSNFKNGIACAGKENSGVGLFSINGEWVVSPIYEEIYRKGNYYIAYNNTHHVIFDKNGETVKVISNFELGDMQIDIYGDRIFYYLDDYSQEKVSSQFYDSGTGELICCKETGRSVTAYINGTEFFYCNDGSFTYIVNMDGNTVAKLEGAGDIQKLNDGYFVFVEGSWRDDYQNYNMYSFDGFKKIWSDQIKNTGDRIDIWSYGGDFITKTYLPEQESGELVTNQTYDILEIETGKPVLENLTDYYTAEIDGEIYYCVSDGTYTYTYAPDMTVLMKIRNESND